MLLNSVQRSRCFISVRVWYSVAIDSDGERLALRLNTDTELLIDSILPMDSPDLLKLVIFVHFKNGHVKTTIFSAISNNVFPHSTVLSNNADSMLKIIQQYFDFYPCSD